MTIDHQRVELEPRADRAALRSCMKGGVNGSVLTVRTATRASGMAYRLSWMSARIPKPGTALLLRRMRTTFARARRERCADGRGRHAGRGQAPLPAPRLRRGHPEMAERPPGQRTGEVLQSAHPRPKNCCQETVQGCGIAHPPVSASNNARRAPFYGALSGFPLIPRFTDLFAF